jgi:tRNA threonylcarbamoyladenosine biosynthesis protein TsaE
MERHLNSTMLDRTTTNPGETHELGHKLGAQMQVGDLLLLTGELGSGKTTLTQGIAWGLGVEEYAHSPTFVLVNEYQGRVRLYHMDLYRLEHGQEVHELGIHEMLTEGAGVVEWAEKALEELPSEHLSISITETEPGSRLFHLTSRGERHAALLQSLDSTTAVG